LVFAVLTLLGCYASLVEPRLLKVSEWSVTTEKWTNPKSLKIALITDTHAIWPWMTEKHLERIVEKANQLKPDVILLLGDYVGTHPFGLQLKPEDGVAPFKNLTAPCGVFAVLGNHDIHDSVGWPQALQSTGIPVLQNDAVSLNCEGSRFWVAGLEEIWWQESDIGKTLSQVTDNHPVIMAMHNPDSFPSIPPSVALSVAGHTHGGQIRFPFIGSVAAVIPSQYGERYVYGHIVENGKDLVVSSGLGMTGLPLRFMTRPEIALITLEGSRL
jgi:uncharacterized protein